jgi:WD40 repeat protein
MSRRTLLTFTAPLLLATTAVVVAAAAAPDPPARVDSLGDPLPDGALARIGSVRLRHSGEVGLLAFSNDSKTLFSLGSDQVFRRWDCATGKETGHFERKGQVLYMAPQGLPRGERGGPGGPPVVRGKGDFVLADGVLAATAVADDGRVLATLDSRNAVVVFDTVTGKQLKRLDLREQAGHAVAVSGDGKLLAVAEVGPEDAYVRVYDLANDKELSQLKLGRGRLVSKLLFSHDTKQLAGLIGGQIRIWDVAAGKRLRFYEGHDNVVFGLAYSRDDKFLVTAAADGSVRVWDTGSEEEVRKFVSMEVPFTCVEFTPDGRHVIAGGLDRNIHLWEIATEREKVIEGNGGPLLTVAISPDGALLAAGDGTGLIRIYDAVTGKEKEPVKQPERLNGLGLRDGGRTLVLWAVNGQIRHVDALSGVERHTAKVPNDESLQIETSPDGQLAVVINREDEQLKLWDGIKGQECGRIAGHPGGTGLVCFSADSRHVLTSGADNTVRVWSAATGKEVVQVGNVTALCMALSPDGKLLAVATTEDELCLFETASARERCRFRLSGAANSIALRFSPDGKYLAMASGDEVIRLWDVVRGKLLRGLVGHQGAVLTLAFAPAGELLASGGSDGTVRLWDVKGGEELQCFDGHAGGVTRVAFADDGKTLVSTGADNVILVWDPAARPGAQEGGKGKKMDQLWADLASDDGMISFKAMVELIGAPKEAVQFLGTKLQPVPGATPEAIAKLVEELDDKQFAVRSKATRELEKLGGQARAALEKAAAKPASAELEARVKKLLDRLDGPVSAPEDLQVLRAVEVLERIATPEARELLARLAKGAPGARQTREAEDSLKRLTK